MYNIFLFFILDCIFQKISILHNWILNQMINFPFLVLLITFCCFHHAVNPEGVYYDCGQYLNSLTFWMNLERNYEECVLDFLESWNRKYYNIVFCKKMLESVKHFVWNSRKYVRCWFFNYDHLKIKSTIFWKLERTLRHFRDWTCERETKCVWWLYFNFYL